MKVSVDEAAVTVAKAVDVDVVKKVDGADVTVATGLITSVLPTVLVMLALYVVVLILVVGLTEYLVLQALLTTEES